jgi:hypothetical protein
MCLRRAPEKYIAGAALDRADLGHSITALPPECVGCPEPNVRRRSQNATLSGGEWLMYPYCHRCKSFKLNSCRGVKAQWGDSGNTRLRTVAARVEGSAPHICHLSF